MLELAQTWVMVLWVWFLSRHTSVRPKVIWTSERPGKPDRRVPAALTLTSKVTAKTVEVAANEDPTMHAEKRQELVL